MRKAYIITYDLANPNRNYEDLLKKIKSFKIWARLGTSSYAIVVKKEIKSADIRDFLVEILNKDDKLFVSSLGNSAAWSGYGDEFSNWVRKALSPRT